MSFRSQIFKKQFFLISLFLGVYVTKCPSFGSQGIQVLTDFASFVALYVCWFDRTFFLQVARTVACFDPVGVPTLYSWRKLATHVVLLLASRVANEAKFVLFMSSYNLDAFQMSLNAWHRQSTVTPWQVNQIVQGRPTNLSATLKYGNTEKGRYDLPNFGRDHTACVAARPCCCCVLNLW